MPPRYVIFDCDGVLVDSEPISNRLLAEALTAIGLPTTTEESIAAYMGRSWVSNIADIEARLGRKAPPDLRARVSEDMRAAFERELGPVPGIAAALDRIELPRCVASSSDPAHIGFVLEHTGLIGHFTHTFSATEVEHGKPAPDLFLHAAAGMGVPPERCAVIEDSVHGVRAGVAAGMTTYGYAGGLSDESALASVGADTFLRMADLWAGPGIE